MRELEEHKRSGKKIKPRPKTYPRLYHSGLMVTKKGRREIVRRMEEQRKQDKLLEQFQYWLHGLGTQQWVTDEKLSRQKQLLEYRRKCIEHETKTYNLTVQKMHHWLKVG